MIELEMISGAAKGQHLKTKVPFISLGRAPERTIFIDDPFVSRHHGEIVLLDEGYQYRDLNSTHGTVLLRDGEQHFVRQIELRTGDELAIGATDNVLHVARLELAGIDKRESSVTRLHSHSDHMIAPEERYAQDSKALRALVAFDSAIMDANVTTERLLYRTMLEHIGRMFSKLQYVSVLEMIDDRPQPFDFEIIDPESKVRLSTNILRMTQDQGHGMVFEVVDSGTLMSEGEKVELSDQSMVMPLDGIVKIQTGICVPIRHAPGAPKFLQMERLDSGGTLGPRELGLVDAMVSRVSDRLNNFNLIDQNQRLRHTASLGLFAGMIGHDIKNYLFYSKKLSEIQNEPLNEHIGLSKGIERARKLAQSMKDLSAPGRVTLTNFSAGDLARAVVSEFDSLFGGQCAFEAVVDDDVPNVTTNEDLLSRAVWNVVMNAYHSMENRSQSASGKPLVRIRVKRDTRERVSIGVIDNAGGIGPQTIDYIQRLFKLIWNVYEERENLIDVVDEMHNMNGFTNSVGLFFTATAINDMRGKIRVDTKQGEGSVFVIKIPEKIDSLKNLLVY